MLKKTLAVRPNFKIVVTSSPGDLRLTGWDRDEVSAKTDGDTLDLVLNGETVTINCDDDLILTVPQGAAVQIENADGDVAVRTLRGALSFGTVSGDLALREVGAVAIGTLEGDLSLRTSSGPISAAEVSGDVSIRDVKGNISLQSVEADLYLSGINGNVMAHVQGDASLYLNPVAGMAINVSAEDDILLHLPANANATMTLSSDDPDDIQVQVPAAMISGKNPRSVILGDGSAVIKLEAEGDILVTSESGQWEDAAEFANFGEGWGMADLSDRINRRVQEATRRAQRQAEAAARRTEQKMSQQGRRFSFNWGGQPGHPMPPAEPVSDEERMAILKMLQDKKISAEDAEKLLAALEGGA